ncbi:MAG TPA: TaqI-like C-terminal specificity domain-containing protein [Solirubrobacterales bacterium]|jgi:type I restriction-modification system DNA methylase subunit
MPRSRRAGTQPLELLGPSSLLDNAGRARVLEQISNADELTRQRWSQRASALVAALNAGWIENSTEVALHGEFLSGVFGELLGYTGALAGASTFTMSASVTTEVDATEADGTLGHFTAPGVGKTRAVIELKDARTNLDKRQLSRPDRLTPVDQAFLYANKFTGCQWVIVSNFLELRLYSVRHGQTIYERLWLRDLPHDDRLLEFLALLSPPALIGDRPDAEGYLADLLVDRPAVRQRQITEDFYAGYADKRNRLIHYLIAHHRDEDPVGLISAAQTLLDRILFIAFAEDRPLLPDNLLRDTGNNAQLTRSRSTAKVWDELRALFRDIDVGSDNSSNALPAIPAYNGGLFAEDLLLDHRISLPDELVLDLIGLGDYDYRRTIDVEILGHVFEQSISDLESLRAAHSLDPLAVESSKEETAEARRSLGVYYTPQWVTEYVVNATLGETATADGVDPGRFAEIQILDPACGSGAFLAQAYRYLLELAAASTRDVLPDEQTALSEQAGVAQPSAYLSGLHGIDIMDEAVEIVRLSLWLASASPLERLELLDGIAEGNTLAQLEGESPLNLLFPGEMASGGFDVVIGNPPWGAKLDFELDPSLELAEGQFDSYELFVERSMKDALCDGGILGFVIPDRFLRPEGERLRRWLIDNYRLTEIIKLGEGVFPDVARAAVILIVRKATPSDSDEIRTLSVSAGDRSILEETGATYLHSLLEERAGTISRARIAEDPAYNIPLGAAEEDFSIMASMLENSRPWLGEDGIFDPYGRGVELGADGFVIRCNACFSWQVGPRKRAQARGGGYLDKECPHCEATISDGDWAEAAHIISEGQPTPGRHEDQGLPGDGWHPLFVGQDISRYHLRKRFWIRLGVSNINYKTSELYAPPKLLIRQAGVGINVAVDESDAYCLQSAYVYRVRDGLDASPYFFLACLASRAMLFYFHRYTNQTEWQSFPKLVHTTLQQLPLPDPERVDPKLRKSIEDKARRRMGLDLDEAHDLDLEIEHLVMEAYGLSSSQRQRIIRTLRSVQRLRVIREMFPSTDQAQELL